VICKKQKERHLGALCLIYRPTGVIIGLMQRILNIETPKYSGKEVEVAGWVNSIRSHGKILFVDLRDRSGLLQIIFTPKEESLYKLAQQLRPEWVIGVKGKIGRRPSGMVNPKVVTGGIELQSTDLEIFSQAKTLPFPIDTLGYEISEEKRLKYRYLDLRRERMRKNLKVRHKVTHLIRDFLTKEEFVEIETPILTKSTPEGARDFLVPSRLQPGKFYALPQSPQQYKQMLQVAGMERYFQIARALRDEDPRADRQAEHTQLDIEMSFVSQEEILDLTERLYLNVVRKLFPQKRITKIPFPRTTYKKAMEKYGTDKPDLRRNKKDSDELAFVFITDFPMFEWKSSFAKATEDKEGIALEGKGKRLAGRSSKSEGRWGAMHHPFTLPQTDDIKRIKADPGKILAFQYDFVLNGYEIGGGSLRTTNLDVFTAVFEVLGHKKQELKKQFKHYFEAFSYGVPPHGGIAPGIDRFLFLGSGVKGS